MEMPMRYSRGPSLQDQTWCQILGPKPGPAAVQKLGLACLGFSVCVWVCGCVGVWVWGCGGVGVWGCGGVGVWGCGGVGVWGCGGVWGVGVWVCGCVGVWVCGCVCVRACVHACVRAWVGVWTICIDVKLFLVVLVFLHYVCRG